MRNGSSLWQKLVAEGLGTCFLVLFGAGAITATYNIQRIAALVSEANLGIIALSFAIIIAAMTYAFARVSGAHFNPAITVGLAVRKHIDWLTAGAYIVAQFIGGFIGALLIALFYGRFAATAGILGAPSYQLPTSTYQAFFAEAIGTFVLVFTVYALAVDRNAPPGWAGLIIGLIVGGVMMLIAPVTGGAINPARAFGPMLAQVALGGPNLLGQFWLYLVAPLVGAIAAAFAYEFITAHAARPTTIPAGPQVSGREARQAAESVERERHMRRPEPPPDLGGAAHA